MLSPRFFRFVRMGFLFGYPKVITPMSSRWEGTFNMFLSVASFFIISPIQQVPNPSDVAVNSTFCMAAPMAWLCFIWILGTPRASFESKNTAYNNRLLRFFIG